MKSFKRCFCSILLAALLAVPMIASAGWATGTYKNTAGERTYRVWAPDGYDGSETLPLVMVLHGCSSDADHMAAASGFNDVADVERFLVVYPIQPSSLFNPYKCWKWEVPANQARGSGEPSILAGIITKVKADYAVDSTRVYVTGISAGGAMAATMLACYSDVFAAGAIHAGAMYKPATTTLGGLNTLLYGSIYSPDTRGKDAWACSGKPSPRPLPVLVFHGSDDTVVNPVNGQQAVRQFLQTNDMADDGLDNNTVGTTPTSTTTAQVPGGHNYTVDTYAYNGQVLAQHYLVEGMGHAWSGGNAAESFTDPDGPDSTVISWLFFKNNQR